MAGVTVAQQAERIRRRLYGGSQSRYNVLNANITADDTAFTLADTFNGVQVGGRIGIGSEIMWVRAIDGLEVTVIRGFLGSTPATHEVGDLVEVQPRFPLADVIDTMREEVESWGEQLFRVETRPISGVSDQRDYDLTGADDPLFILGLTRGTVWDSSQSNVPHVFLRDQDTASFSSGFAIQLRDRPPSGVNFIVAWAEPLDASRWTDSTDLIGTVGMKRAWLDVLTYGTLWRLMSGREVNRTDLQAGGDVRRDESVPPGYQAKVASEFMDLRNRRLADEANNLRARYPYRVG